ncbi:hypothetical protein BO82DRAFT_51345 [Aspergillus uvarum CBS 121591]|uniref:Uncharacterized protein n=1 Tax=Aspergillus uvarum CBS 121591 TaxID=1448315 RepID=A0A319CMQ8_9EURO|nr:hypothetical protein BO82DRAFT_51345 [Aspergillus uvarum CBS 121591]PYH86766.1 hypothetical protein BO82DRAFT_51345 [Aspergillus uvarum CBS 121591]
MTFANLLVSLGFISRLSGVSWWLLDHWSHYPHTLADRSIAGACRACYSYFESYRASLVSYLLFGLPHTTR